MQAPPESQTEAINCPTTAEAAVSSEGQTMGRAFEQVPGPFSFLAHA
jgi:hypothetical protein